VIPKLTISSKKLRLIALVIIVLGILVRCTVYFQNRSLIMDEANLARDIYEKEYVDLFKSFDSGQCAPPLFSVTAKASIHLFGVNEFALRLPSLIAGIISLVFLLMIVNHLVAEPPSRWYVLLLFSFSILAIRYSSEFKQFAVDGAITLFFILWALRCRNKDLTVPLTVKWVVLGSLAIWLSMPIIFVLASIGIAFLYGSWKRNKGNIPHLLIIGVSWLLSFGSYYFLLLQNETVTESLHQYHSPFFFKFFPTDHTSLSQSYDLLISLFRLATDKTTVSIVWAILTFTIGSIFLITKDKLVAILLLSPILLCLIASHLQLYSLIERLTLFMIPLLMVIIGIGLSYVWTRSNQAVKVFLVAIMLLSVVNKYGYQYFWKSMEQEDSKSVMLFLSKYMEDDEFLFVQYDGVPAFLFYNNMHDKAWNFKNYYLAGVDEMVEEVLPTISRSSTEGNFWLFLSHTFPQHHIERHISSAKKIGVEINRYVSVQASTYEFERKK